MFKNRSFLSFIALVLLIYFAGLPLLGMILTGYFGSISELIDNAIDLLPFGDLIWDIVCSVIYSIVQSVENWHISPVSFLTEHTSHYVIQEVCKTVLTCIVFRLLSNLFCCFLGLDEPKGIWNKLKRAIIVCMVAIVSACLIPLIIHFCFQQINTLSELASNIFSFLVSVITIGGGVLFYIAVTGILTTAAVIVVATVFTSLLQLFFSYFFLFVLLIALNNNNYLLGFCGISGLIVTGVVVALISEILGKKGFKP